MLYLLGLSYGATSLALEGLGVYLCKSRVYDAVQETAKRVPGLKRDQVFAGVKTPALGGDLTSVKRKGEWVPLGITVDPITGLALTIDALAAQDIKALQDWIEPIARSVGATVLVAKDADGSLDAIGVSPEQAAADLRRLGELVKSRRREQAAELEAQHPREKENTIVWPIGCASCF
jgi:hypothetical protein